MTTSQLLEHHRETKRAIIGRLEQLAEVSESVGMLTLARGIRTTRIPKLDKEHFHLVVLGEFNHGKSTFVNALLGADVLPTGITPTTAVINHVVWSDGVRAHAVLISGEEVTLSADALDDWVTVAGPRSGEVAYVEVGYPSDLLRENITLVDTPGVNDINEARAEITYGYVPRADAVIFLLDAQQALKDSEREFLSSHVLEGSRDRLIFVLGKVDVLNQTERDAVLDYVRGGLAKLIDQPAVFPLSARDWLVGDREQSGMPELLDYLERFLDTDRAQILLDNAAADAVRTAAYLEQNLGVKLYAFDLDLAELEARIKSVRQQLDASKKTLDQLHTKIQAKSEAIKEQMRLDLDEFARAFIKVLPDQIDSVDADDVKTHLPGFIEAKFREFAELEGHKLAGLLEGLAEEVIAVTNENVAAASAALANRIGPSETQVQIDVDSFKYDVSVYALGAIGTAVLFVNVVAGGLLTLAAPVLAVLLKSKVAGDIREQAKERVPETVQKAADAMQPHFVTCVDDFATRLRDFVIAAGNTLYKGISEILDRTIAERRERGGAIEPLRAETSDRIKMVIAAKNALTQLREALWQSQAAMDGDNQGDGANDGFSNGAGRRPDNASASSGNGTPGDGSAGGAE
ncbi:MAG: dynamin family protein [Proteobacteria bacterium]|nr:dynamin family protein [Pseudomonadota bacterium]